MLETNDTVRAGCGKPARPVRRGRTERQSGRSVLYSTVDSCDSWLSRSPAPAFGIQVTLPSLDRSRLLALGWAAFVAVSWTWCIGMYLPVLMIRDFGLGAWFVFAIPNIVGAAALGWVLHRPGAAAELSRRHWPAAVAFSIVTVLFHAFFVGWIVRALIGDVGEIITAAAVILVFVVGRVGRRDLVIAAVVLVISLIAFV